VKREAPGPAPRSQNRRRILVGLQAAGLGEPAEQILEAVLEFRTVGDEVPQGRAVVRTVAPRSLASWVSSSPTPPAWMRTVSAGPTAYELVVRKCAFRPCRGSAAACSSVTVAPSVAVVKAG